MTRWPRRKPTIVELDAYLDDELTPAATTRVEEALASSAQLRADLHTLFRVRRALELPLAAARGGDLVARFQATAALERKLRATIDSEADSTDGAPEPRHPLTWVPTSYMVMGLVYATLGAAANVMFSDLGLRAGTAATLSSLIGAPYIFKSLWAPLVELYRTKKFFVVATQVALAATIGAVACTLTVSGARWPVPVVSLLAIAALLGATQDVGGDGVYVTALRPKEQAAYFGFQTLFWTGGELLASGPLVTAAGVLNKRGLDWSPAWAAIMAILATIVAAAAVYHARVLPSGARAKDAPGSFRDAVRTFARTYGSFFQKKGVIGMILFAFLYRIGYGMLDKIAPLFMIAERAQGGLGLSHETLGLVYGSFGTVAWGIGSLLGGWVVSRVGLRTALLPLCLWLNIPNIAFIILSQTAPSDVVVISALVMITKFGWGMGMTGQMLYMMQQISPGPYRTAHYTFATALMAAGVLGAGALSGCFLQAAHYRLFFVIAVVAGIPSVLVTIFAPYSDQRVTREPRAAAA